MPLLFILAKALLLAKRNAFGMIGLRHSKKEIVNLTKVYYSTRAEYWIAVAVWASSSLAKPLYYALCPAWSSLLPEEHHNMWGGPEAVFSRYAWLGYDFSHTASLPFPLLPSPCDRPGNGDLYALLLELPCLTTFFS
jgi:hypothetical protein